MKEQEDQREFRPYGGKSMQKEEKNCETFPSKLDFPPHNTQLVLSGQWSVESLQWIGSLTLTRMSQECFLTSDIQNPNYIIYM